MRVLVINGPNPVFSIENGKRIFDGRALTVVENRMEERAEEYGWEIDFCRTVDEGEIISLLTGAHSRCDAVILNAGAYGSYSLAIRDAIEAIDLPVIEVRMHNAFADGERGASVLAPACRGFISGFGAASYILAMEALVEIIE